MENIPTEMWDLVKDNPIVQWFLAAVFILTVGTNTATKLKGPVGKFARWFRELGERRTEREAAERREKRLKLIQEAAEQREMDQAELAQLHEQVRYLYQNQRDLEALIRVHLGWDYERVRQLLALGVQAAEIPEPPPLRVELKDPDTVPRPAVSATGLRSRHRAPDTGAMPQVRSVSV